jgi:hypothetical protein
MGHQSLNFLGWPVILTSEVIILLFINGINAIIYYVLLFNYKLVWSVAAGPSVNGTLMIEINCFHFWVASYILRMFIILTSKVIN